MTSGQERAYWRAVNRLREAETLAQLSGSVSGPADAPPGDGDEKSWVEDWAKRAKDSLKKAHDWAAEKKQALKDRARAIAEHVAKGVKEIYRASPVGRASQALKDVGDAANTITLATFFGTSAITLLILAGIAWYFLRKHGHA